MFVYSKIVDTVEVRINHAQDEFCAVENTKWNNLRFNSDETPSTN